MKPEKVIYELGVGKLTKNQKYEDTPQKYKVVEADTASGIMVYGFINGRWVANPNTRELIAHLLRTGY